MKKHTAFQQLIKAMLLGVSIFCCQSSKAALRDSQAAVHTNDSTWTDYVYNLTVEPIITDHNGMGWDFWQNAYIYFRVTDWFDNGISSGPVGYMLGIQGPHHGLDPSIQGTFSLSSRPNTFSSHLLYQSDLGVIPDGPINFSIWLCGPRIMIAINGNIIADVIDPEPILYGGIAVGAVWETEARFDNISVTGVSGTMFSDNFNTGMSPEWVSINGTQWVQNGWLHSKVGGIVPEPSVFLILGFGGLIIRRQKILRSQERIAVAK